LGARYCPTDHLETESSGTSLGSHTRIPASDNSPRVDHRHSWARLARPIPDRGSVDRYIGNGSHGRSRRAAIYAGPV